MKLPLTDIFLLAMGLASLILFVGSVIRYIKIEIDYKKWKDGNGK